MLELFWLITVQFAIQGYFVPDGMGWIKVGGRIDALDSAEFTGSLIILLNEGFSFVKRNMKTAWKKTANSRIELPDYCERSVFESIVNALIHRLWKAFHKYVMRSHLLCKESSCFSQNKGFFLSLT